MIRSWRHGVRIAVPALVVAVAIAACSPEDYPPPPPPGGEASHEIVGGADPTAVSGRARSDSGDTIHHPRADGNDGRAPDRPGTTAESGATTGVLPGA